MIIWLRLECNDKIPVSTQNLQRMTLELIIVFRRMGTHVAAGRRREQVATIMMQRREAGVDSR